MYHKHNRAEYNRWERDCEGYFVQSPSRFQIEARKVEFGVRYVAENLKTLWQAHVASNLHLAPLWTPTWLELKTVMLNALGTPAERRQAAYEALKRCRQRPGQSPTDLLDYMRPLWEELGDFHPEEMKVLEYTAALHDSIHKDLYLIPYDRRTTLPAVEEQANIISRRLPSKGAGYQSLSQGSTNQPKKAGRNSRKHQKSPSGSEGDGRTPKNAKGGNSGQSGQKNANRKSSGMCQ